MTAPDGRRWTLHSWPDALNIPANSCEEGESCEYRSMHIEMVTAAALDAAEAERNRYKKERYDLLAVKTTEGLSAAEWMSRTATAEARVKELEARIRELERPLSDRWTERPEWARTATIDRGRTK